MSPTDARTLHQIHEYIWIRYVQHERPELELEEAQALAQLEAHYASHPLEADAECFYYGILAFERAFAEPSRRTELLERALTVFRAYRSQTSDGFAWEAVEDRYQDTLEQLGRPPASAVH